MPAELVGGRSDSIQSSVTIHLRGNKTAILGSFRDDHDDIIFEPLVAFTRGLTYEIMLKGHSVGEFTVPMPDKADAPVVLAVYPTQDTLPENLLKFYIVFSRSMREGQAMNRLALVKDKLDTIPGVFLDLQPELWNQDGTILTVWLDPGRVKRDLIPNKLLGTPIRRGEHYTLNISDQWQDKNGSPLQGAWSKPFVVTGRDSLSPDPKTWLLKSPPADGRESLIVDFKAPLDFLLVSHVLHVVNEQGKEVEGSWLIGKEEATGNFEPAATWEKGQYSLEIETRLEDLAGNNLNRPFDRDIKNTSVPTDDKIVVLKFVVHKN